jgi:hypothetical protein
VVLAAAIYVYDRCSLIVCLYYVPSHQATVDPLFHATASVLCASNTLRLQFSWPHPSQNKGKLPMHNPSRFGCPIPFVYGTPPGADSTQGSPLLAASLSILTSILTRLRPDQVAFSLPRTLAWLRQGSDCKASVSSSALNVQDTRINFNHDV